MEVAALSAGREGSHRAQQTMSVGSSNPRDLHIITADICGIVCILDTTSHGSMIIPPERIDLSIKGTDERVGGKSRHVLDIGVVIVLRVELSGGVDEGSGRPTAADRT